MLELRSYQQEAKTRLYDSWRRGARNTLVVLPTGAGKTVIFSDVIREHKGACCAIAHRQELVFQISLALARDEVYHKIIGPTDVIKLCVATHIREVGKSYYRPSSSCAVAGVDTLKSRRDALYSWAQSVTLWVQDEAHHVLRDNKWGAAVEMFPNARGLGVTATPLRADNKGLGVEYDGVFHDMIVGPSMRDLINMGFLTDYDIYSPRSDLDLSSVPISKATGDFSKPKLSLAVEKSHIVGDVVENYIKIARGKLGVTFATDVKTAGNVADKFNQSGVPAAVVSAKTPNKDRAKLIQKFRNRELLQLVNVDLFGEGFDLPAIEVVSMARPTQSYGLYVQQFGRALRIMEGKKKAIIIDHVDNVLTRHGLPDAPRQWSLAPRAKRGTGKKEDVTPLKVCLSCTAVYSKLEHCCPYCGFEPTAAPRSGPVEVDGDLTQISPEILARMRGEIDKIDMGHEEYRAMLVAKHMPTIGQLAELKRHLARQEAQGKLRAAMAQWGGYQRAAKVDDRKSYKKFYLTFGIDVLGAQALKQKEALELEEKINENIRSFSNAVVS